MTNHLRGRRGVLRATREVIRSLDDELRQSCSQRVRARFIVVRRDLIERAERARIDLALAGVELNGHGGVRGHMGDFDGGERLGPALDSSGRARREELGLSASQRLAHGANGGVVGDEEGKEQRGRSKHVRRA